MSYKYESVTHEPILEYDEICNFRWVHLYQFVCTPVTGSGWRPVKEKDIHALYRLNSFTPDLVTIRKIHPSSCEEECWELPQNTYKKDWYVTGHHGIFCPFFD